MALPAEIQNAVPVPPLLALLFAVPGCTTPLWSDKHHQTTLDALKDNAIDERVRGFAGSRQLAVESVREVLAVLAAGPPLDRDAVLAALRAQLEQGGALVPPLAVLQGGFELAFDAAMQLAVSADMAEALAPEDEGVTSAAAQVRAAQAVAQEDFLVKTRLQQLHKALAGAGLAEQHSALVAAQLQNGRHYRQCQVLGGAYLQAALHPAAGGAPLRCYLEVEHGPLLPLLSRFDARLLAEVHPSQDAAAAGTCALRVVALARVVAAERWTAGQWSNKSGTAAGS